ncbi:MAG: right-handed parallel beta-helix repeat-containing protein [Planctomycetota bacterium]
MKRLLTICLVLLLCAPVYATKISAADDSTAIAAVQTTADAIEILNSDVLALLKSGANVWYVDSGATGSGTGVDWTNAETTIEAAIANCTANAGDFIVCAPYHAETASTGTFDLDKDGVTLIGLGKGDAMATITYDTTTDTCLLGAGGDGCTIRNIKFFATISAVASAIVVEDGCTDFIIEDCIFKNETTTVDEFIDAIYIHGTNANNGIIRRNTFEGDVGANAGPQSSIGFEDAHFLQIYENEFSGDIAVAHIENKTTASNYITIRDNRIICGYIGAAGTTLDTTPGISLVATTTGWIQNNFIVTNVVSPADAIVAADCYLSGNMYTEIQGVGGSAEPIGGGNNLAALAALGVAETDGTTRGNIVYVDSGETTSVEDGLTWATAFDTIDEAINACTDDDGSTIFVAPGHTENMGTTDPDADVTGLTIIGLGVGEHRPVLSADTSTDIFQIDGDDIKIKGLDFLAHTPDVAKGINITANSENVVISDCRFSVHTEATDEFLVTICVGADADDLLIENCRIANGGGASTVGILFDGAYEYPVIRNNLITGDYSTACINGDATGDGEMALIENNILYNGDITIGLNTEPCIELKSGTTAFIRNNMLICDESSAAAAVVAADAYLAGNTYTETEGSGTALEVGKTYVRVSSAASVAASAVDLFDVLGGPIEILAMWGHCTTVMASNPGALSLIIDATDGDSDADFTTAVNIDALGKGDTVKMENVAAVGESVIVITANENAAMPISWFCPIGMIEQKTASTGTGDITWYMVFRPLVDGVTVTVQ